MNQKNKNILVYVGIVIAVIIVIVMAFILGTKVGNNADENGGVNSNKTNISMTKEELKNYLTTFIENYDVENAVNQNYSLQQDDEFWFAVRVYLNTTEDGKKQLNDNKGYKIPSSKITEITQKYFTSTNEMFDPSSELINVTYDDNSKEYIIDKSYDFLLPTFDGIKYSTTLSELVENNTNKVATLIVTFEDNTYDEYTFLLNSKYGIMYFAKGKTSNSTKTSDNINYEVKTSKVDKINVTDNSYIDIYAQLYVNDTLVKIGDSNSKYPYSFSPITIKQLDDILIACISLGNNDTRLYAIDSNGIIIKEFNNLKGNVWNIKVYGNDIYTSSVNKSINLSDSICKILKENPDSEFSYTEKITYLGNNNFSELEFIESNKAEKYLQQEECK